MPCLARHLLHRHGVVPVEGDRHHADQLPASLHPQVPAQALLPAQLLQVDLLEGDGNLPRPRGRRWNAQRASEGASDHLALIRHGRIPPPRHPPTHARTHSRTRSLHGESQERHGVFARRETRARPFEAAFTSTCLMQKTERLSPCLERSCGTSSFQGHLKTHEH